jgi:hypothetical protein
MNHEQIGDSGSAIYFGGIFGGIYRFLRDKLIISE